MDALSLAYLVKSTYNKLQNVEKFEDAKTATNTSASTPAPVIVPEAKPVEGKSSIGMFFGIISLIFVILFGSYAAYLSWFANSLINWQTGWKIFFSFFAFFGGFSYLMTYLIHKLDLLNYIRRSKGEVI